MPNFIPDRVVPASDGDTVDLWVYAVLPKEGWAPHLPGDLIRTDHPGSAIKYGDQIYELMRAEETTGGGYAYRYGLRPWDSHYTLRHLVNYTLQSQIDAAVARQEIARTRRLRHLILWLFPITGFAPAALQCEWEKKTGLRMAWVSAGSAVVGIGAAFALRDVGSDSRMASVVLYLALESFARLFWISISRQPRGSLLLTLPYILWQGLKRRLSPDPAKDANALPPTREDEVMRLPGGNPLQVRSWYFDTILAGPFLVEFEGALYKPLQWHREGKGPSRRWIYDLEMVAPETSLPHREYTCPRTPDRQKTVEEFTRRLDLTNSFALFWSTYPRKDQRRLQIHYQYDGPRSTAMTAAIFLSIGILQLCLATLLLHASILALMLPAYLILESLYRLYKAKVVGKPAGSIFGYILRLAIHPPR